MSEERGGVASPTKNEPPSNALASSVKSVFSTGTGRRERVTEIAELGDIKPADTTFVERERVVSGELQCSRKPGGQTPYGKSKQGGLS